MSRKEFSVAYEGPSRESDHTIDVDILAPALLAFGRLIREANREANGKTSTARVLVVSDFEHKCFNVNFEVVLTFMEQVKQLLGQQEVKNAKDILEWLDLLGGVVTGGVATLGFLGFLKWRGGRKIKDVTQVTDSDQTGQIIVQIEGDHSPVTINAHTWNLANNPKALAAARDALSPIGSDGFERITLRDGARVVGTIPREAAESILSSCMAGIDEAKDITPEIEETTAWLTVYSPVYEAKAGTWRFRLGQDVIHADISQTTIAQDALNRGGALVDDTYQVRLEIETGKNPSGKAKKPTFKVLKVLRFIPAKPSVQQSIPEL